MASNKYSLATILMGSKQAPLLFQKYLQAEQRDPTVTLYPWQRDLIIGGWTDAILLISRQVGKSATMAFLALQEAINHKNSYVPFITSSLSQSLKNMRKVNLMFSWLTGLQPSGRVRLDLPNGSTIEAMPNNEQTVRGSTASLIIIDEGARVPDPLYHAVRPFRIRMKHGRMIVGSTPYGKQGWFYRAWSEENHWLKYGAITWREAGISQERIKIERESMPADIFQQEYECKFLETDSATFAREDILGITQDDTDLIRLKLST